MRKQVDSRKITLWLTEGVGPRWPSIAVRGRGQGNFPPASKQRCVQRAWSFNGSRAKWTPALICCKINISQLTLVTFCKLWSIYSCSSSVIWDLLQQSLVLKNGQGLGRRVCSGGGGGVYCGSKNDVQLITHGWYINVYLTCPFRVYFNMTRKIMSGNKNLWHLSGVSCCWS